MESYGDWNYDDYEENTTENKPNYTYLKYTNNLNSKNSLNIISTSKYSQRLTINSRQRPNLDNKNLKTNYNTNNNYNTYQNNIQINQNSSQYYSQNNKYLITFNSNPRKLELEGKRSSDGVLRGYTNNCSFYVSGSSDLNSTLNDKNKAHKNKEKNHYENKTFENTISHSKNNTNKTNNIKINNNYNITKYENNKLKNKDIKNNNYIKINTNLTNKNINNYKIPISSTNSKEQKA